MKTFHPFKCLVPPGGNPGNVTSDNWNDVHQSGSVPTPYSASGVVPTTVDFIRATGGSGGITLTLTPSANVVTGPSGTYTVYQTYRAKKVDSAAGLITFIDPNGALFDGASSYVLSQQGQWADFIWNGTSWDVFGGQAA